MFCQGRLWHDITTVVVFLLHLRPESLNKCAAVSRTTITLLMLFLIDRTWIFESLFPATQQHSPALLQQLGRGSHSCGRARGSAGTAMVGLAQLC